MTADEIGRRPAFPNQAPLPGGLDRTGLTVRQYYKSIAMQAFIVTDQSMALSHEAIAALAAGQADAMIAEDEAYANGQ